ncbi:hypothetical protein AAFF_G00378740 [Aldrovandia affinis]|uniref:Uncharacterized protein n=1 Tax=Aldrovandia affinis TaxID=143900 RepID=A0AAD7SFV3_9TELE|nr:hypothetical protein AAFF_G00378740 [Aldrovandia affinis]
MLIQDFYLAGITTIKKLNLGAESPRPRQHIHSSPGPSQTLRSSPGPYAPAAWSRSPHVNKVDTVINSALRIVTGCLKPTPVSYLPVLAGITPASLRRDAATLTLARKAQKYDWHILNKATTTPAPPCRLKSRHPYNKAAQEMLQSIPEDLSRDAWLAASWKQTWETAGPSCILRYIRDPGDGSNLGGAQWEERLWVYTGQSVSRQVQMG